MRQKSFGDETIDYVVRLAMLRHDISFDRAVVFVYIALEKLRSDMGNFFRYNEHPASSKGLRFEVTFLNEKFRDALASAADEQVLGGRR